MIYKQRDVSFLFLLFLCCFINNTWRDCSCCSFVIPPCLQNFRNYQLFSRGALTSKIWCKIQLVILARKCLLSELVVLMSAVSSLWWCFYCSGTSPGQLQVSQWQLRPTDLGCHLTRAVGRMGCSWKLFSLCLEESSDAGDTDCKICLFRLGCSCHLFGNALTFCSN